MSPLGATIQSVSQSFPRVSGDEPTLTVNAQTAEGFSPREWG